MICCAVLSVLLGPLFRVRRLAGRGRRPVTTFAPPARRPAPGTEPAASIAVETITYLHGLRALGFRAAAATATLYLAVLVVLVQVGVAESQAGLGAWTLRTLAYAAVTAALLATAARTDAGPAPTRSRTTGFVMLAAGMTWFELGVLDMHLFGLFDIAGGALLWDLVFHGSGVLAVLAGAATVWWPAPPITARLEVSK